jgi:hypothetical protein
MLAESAQMLDSGRRQDEELGGKQMHGVRRQIADSAVSHIVI